MMLHLLDSLPFTSFIETGTSRGYSTELVALHRPHLPIHTCEVVPETHSVARMALRAYRNVTCHLGSSDHVVASLIAEGRAGLLPLYYLDAHWQEYWPLRKELEHISGVRGQAVIVIDDFEVPGQSQFGFDLDGGYNAGAGVACNLEYIRPSLEIGNHYQALFPRYGYEQAFGPGSGPQDGALRGHIVIFQNMQDECEVFAAHSLIGECYLRTPSIVAP